MIVAALGVTVPDVVTSSVLEAVSEELAGKVSFYSVDVDDCPGLAEEYRVQSVPNLVLLKKGAFVDQSIGFKPQPAISAWVKGNL